VIAYLNPNPIAYTVIDFVVANVGKSVAPDIKFTFEPTLSDMSGPHASFQAPTWVAFDSGIPTLAPGQQLSCLWAQSTIVLADATAVAKRHTVTIQYSGDSPAKGPFSDPYVLDVGSFRDLMRLAAKTLEDEVRALESIRDILKRWSERDGIRTYTEGLLEHRERQAREMRESIERLQAQTKPPEEQTEPPEEENTPPGQQA
jgi:hypothetical protein